MADETGILPGTQPLFENLPDPPEASGLGEGERELVGRIREQATAVLGLLERPRPRRKDALKALRDLAGSVAYLRVLLDRDGEG